MSVEGNFEKLNSAEILCDHLHNQTAGDPHWSEIDCSKMEEDDATLISKFMNGELSDGDIDKRMERLGKFGRNNQEDSSYALAALLKNKLIAKKYWKRKGEEERGVRI